MVKPFNSKKVEWGKALELVTHLRNQKQDKSDTAARYVVKYIKVNKMTYEEFLRELGRTKYWVLYGSRIRKEGVIRPISAVANLRMKMRKFYHIKESEAAKYLGISPTLEKWIVHATEDYWSDFNNDFQVERQRMIRRDLLVATRLIG